MSHPYDALSETDRYHLSLGQMMAAWSMAETQITFMSAILHRYGRGGEFEKHPPRAFGRKIGMIKDCVPIDPSVSDFADLVAVFCDTADKAATERNLLIHGSVFQPFPDLEPIRFRLDHFGWGDPPEEMRVVSHSQVLALVDLACELALAGQSLAVSFAKALIPNYRDEAAGED